MQDLSEEYYLTLCSKVYSLKDIQKLRIAIGNRIEAFKNKEVYRQKRGLPPIKLQPEEKEVFETIVRKLSENYEGLEGKEKTLKQEIAELAMQHPLWKEWLKNIKGLGAYSAGVLIAELWLRTFKYRSSLKRYCGLGTTQDGKAQNKVNSKNLKDHKYNHFLQSFLLGVVADNFIKQKTPVYYEYYLKKKEEAAQKHPEYVPPPGGWNSVPKDKRHPGRLDKIARREMMILFINHLWEVMHKMKTGKLAPPPQHFKNTPIKPEEYIPPPFYPEPTVSWNIRNYEDIQ